MARKLKIDMDLCSACKLCKSVCIRDNIEIDEFAYELESNCFDCGHCMAVCPQGAITLLKYENQLDRVEEYDSRQIPIDYDDLLQFLKQRRSVRWFKKKKLMKKLSINSLKVRIIHHLHKIIRMSNLLFWMKN